MEILSSILQWPLPEKCSYNCGYIKVSTAVFEFVLAIMKKTNYIFEPISIYHK